MLGRPQAPQGQGGPRPVPGGSIPSCAALGNAFTCQSLSLLICKMGEQPLSLSSHLRDTPAQGLALPRCLKKGNYFV